MNRVRLGVLLAFALVVASSSRAQDLPRNCDLVFPNTPATRLTLTKLATGKYNTYSGGGVVAHCEGQNNTLLADSAEYYEEQGLLYLIGNVHYSEPRAKVDSRTMTYFQADDHLHAEGDVHGVFTNGSEMHGPVADYYRATAQRPLARLVAQNHPILDIVRPEAKGRGAGADTSKRKGPEKARVLAAQIVMEGDSLVYASGQVQLIRPDLTARGDSAFLDNGREFARLMRQPSIEGKSSRPFTLTGGVIDLFSRQRELERVLATPDGHALSKELEMVADSIDLRFTASQISRAIAWGPKRAHAISPDREIIADSIDAYMPEQHPREIFAVRKAFASSTPDTAQIISTERDWMLGDTIVARFDSVAPADSAAKARIRLITASGNARSFYQVRSARGPRDRPAINYVRGRLITVDFRDGKVATVVVTDKAAGVYIDPVTDKPQLPGRTGPGTGGAPARPPSRTSPVRIGR